VRKKQAGLEGKGVR